MEDRFPHLKAAELEVALELEAERHRVELAAATEAVTSAYAVASEQAARVAHLEAQVFEQQLTAESDAIYRSGRAVRTRDASGKAIEGPIDRTLREIATRAGLDEARTWARNLPQVIPIGFMQSSGEESPTAKHPLLANPEVQRRLKATGVTEEMVMRFRGLEGVDEFTERRR